MKSRQLATIHALLGLAAALCGLGVCAQEVPHFPIRAFAVEGNTLLREAEIDAAVSPFIGPRRDFGDVQHALEALEAVYKKHGYTTVSVLLPEQRLEEGRVLFKIVEGRLHSIRISGQKYHDAENIRATLPTLKTGDAPRMDDISANLRIANENPAKKIALQLQPGDREEDIDAIVKVTDERPWSVGLTLDNTGTTQTGKLRLGLSLQHANLLNRDHVLTFQYQTAPEKPQDVNVYALAYRVPLYELGDAVDVYATQSDVNAGTIAAGPINLNISGKGFVYGGRYTLNLKRRGDYEQQLVFGLDEKAFQNNIGVGGLQLGNDITVHPLSLQYNGHWQFASSDISLFGGYVQNLSGGNKGRQADFDKARAGAPASYMVLRGGLAASHAYRNDWQIRLSASAQWTDAPLIPGEQFGIGGASSVRGFDEREIANDQGFQTSLEIYSPELCGALGSGHRCRALGFIDSGAVSRIQPLPGEQVREHIGSTGLGVRYSLDRQVAFQADYGYVLQGGGSRAKGDWLVHAKLGILF